jgi:hypothetical protein
MGIEERDNGAWVYFFLGHIGRLASRLSPAGKGGHITWDLIYSEPALDACITHSLI